MSESWTQIIIQVLVGGSFAVMTYVLKDLKDQIKENSDEVRKNTLVWASLNVKLELMSAKVETVERETLKTMAEIQSQLRKHDGDIDTLGERSHGAVNALITLWGVATHNGWQMPTDYPEMPSRFKKRDR